MFHLLCVEKLEGGRELVMSACVPPRVHFYTLGTLLVTQVLNDVMQFALMQHGLLCTHNYNYS